MKPKWIKLESGNIYYIGKFIYMILKQKDYYQLGIESVGVSPDKIPIAVAFRIKDVDTAKKIVELFEK